MKYRLTTERFMNAEMFMNTRRPNADGVPGSVDIHFMGAEIQEDGKVPLTDLSHIDKNRS